MQMPKVRLLAFSLVVPLVSIATLKFTTYLGDRRIHSEFQQSIEQSQKIAPENKQAALNFFNNLNLSETCLKKTAEDVEWVSQLGLQSTCDRWEMSRIAILVAVGYSVGLVFYFGFLATLVPFAKKNVAGMALAYRVGWATANFVSIVSTIVVAGLLSLAFFELTVAVLGRYFPKLLGLIILGGIFATYTTLKILFQKTPLEFAQGDAAEVSEQEAPGLWKRVRALAARVGTEPPTSILLGSELNFFVTEFSVAHLAGKSAGRVLYLSSPLMKTLSEQEVDGIIGHELGHFKGEDTALTKFFYPFKQKAYLTYTKLFEAPLVTLPAAFNLQMFLETFEPILATHSRMRELAADKVGVAVSSAEDMARALVKVQIHSAAFWQAYHTAVANKSGSLPPERAYFLDYAQKEEAWSDVLTTSVTHPIDTHPATSERLEALGCELGSLRQQVLKSVDGDSAFTVWFKSSGGAVALVEEKHEEVLKTLVDRTQKPPVGAERSTPEGRAWLERNFKELSWEPAKRKVFLGQALLFTIFALVGTPAAWAGGFFGTGMLIVGSAMAMFFPFALFFLIRRLYQANLAASIRINADGIQVGTWEKPLAWDRIKDISASVTHGSCTMTLVLKERVAPLSRFAILPFKTRSLPVSLMVYPQSYEEILPLIHRYWSELKTDSEVPS